MNLRIDKLIDDARLTAVAEMFEVELTKFAELIVQECVGICECEWNGDADTFAASEAYNECADAIKEHFGVEL
jgi:hypothetical protein